MAAPKKKRRWIGLLAAILALALLLGVYWALNRGQTADDGVQTAPPDASAPALERIPAATIQRLVLTRDGERIELELTDDTWILGSEPERPIDPSRMAKITYALSTFTVKRLIEKDPADLSVYGLSEPAVTVEAFSPTESEKIALGLENPATGDRYILWNDGTVYTADSTALADLDATLSDLTFRESMPSIELEDVRRMTVLDGSGASVLTLEHLDQPKADDFSQSYLWYVQQDGREYPAKTTYSETLVKRCLSLEIGESLSYQWDEGQLARYGLDVPSLAVVVETDRGPILTILFGKEEDGRTAMRFNDCKGIYSVSDTGLTADLTQDILEYRPLEWVRIPQEDLTGLNLVFSGLGMEMNKSEDQWYLNGSEMDAADWSGLYSALCRLTPQGWADREIAEDAGTALAVRMTREGQTQLVRFREYDVGFYAAEIQGEAEMLFSRRDVDAFRSTASDVYLKAVEKQDGTEDGEG